MPSLIPGYNYDIFISYRQKDNKGDRWVSEFVAALKTELESTFKEEISVYFDINPSDGLLETHDVDESLKEKLKCLVFIPVISRTYCDPNSFAWVHEFKAFIEQASKDKYGLKVKLPGGNVANRVLPVQIHDLDAEDKKLVEDELGGHLRGIEFIYKEPGINKPLKSGDDDKKNLNKTKYDYQVNKVANAIKEVITAIKQSGPQHEEVSKEAVIPTSTPRKNHKTTIITGLVIALVLVVLCFLIIPKLHKPSEEMEKSIAVLPFINDSPSDSNKYFINGLMEEILSNLQRIKDFRVVSRTSTDQYKGTDRPTIPEIAKKLDVNYIVEGSGQKIGNTFILRVQLIAADKKEKHLWADRYEQEIKDVKDYIRIQSQVAQSIAAELKATITPEEKQLIDETPTTNLKAYDAYQKGIDELNEYSSNDPSTKEALYRADSLFRKAVEYDSTYARAYVGMAEVYSAKHYWDTYLSASYFDSVGILANKALSFDNKLSDAYRTRGNYYSIKGLTEKAFEDFNKALEYNPNDYMVYVSIATIYAGYFDDFAKGIENAQKAVVRYRGTELAVLLERLGNLYVTGFPDKAKFYYQEAFSLHRDSARYLYDLSSIEENRANYEEAFRLAKRARGLDTTLLIGFNRYQFLPSKYDQEVYLYAKKLIDHYNKIGQLPLWSLHRFALAYWRVGKKKEAEYYFNQQIKYDEESVRLGRQKARRGDSYYDLAATYAFLGEKEKAYKNLDEFMNKKKIIASWWILMFNHDPLLDNLRGEQRFQQIVREIEMKAQAEHERVRKYLEERGML